MKRKQLAAIMLSAIMAVSACVPVNGISAAAAENAGAESTEASPVVEVLNEAAESVTEEGVPNAQEETSEASAEEAEVAEASAEEEEEAEAPAEEEEETEDVSAAEEAVDEAAAGEAAAEEESPTAEDSAEAPAEEDEPAAEAPAGEETASAAEEDPAAGASAAATPEAHSAQVIEEDAREEVSLPALRAMQPEDFENAGKIFAGDEKDDEAFGSNDHVVWKFTPDETGSYRFSSDSTHPMYLVIYDADHNEIVHDGGYRYSIEQYFREGTTYYLAAELAYPEDRDTFLFSILITLEQLEIPDLYVEGYSDERISVPYGEEAVLSVFALSSTGEIYYEWQDESGKIVGTSDSYSFTPESNTKIFCKVSDGPDEETACSEYKQFDVSIENHLTLKGEGEYESVLGRLIKSVGLGDPVTLKVTASADDDSRLTYKWRREEVSVDEDEGGGTGSRGEYVTIEGEETNEYTIESAAESGRYCCTVTDRFGNEASLYWDLRVSNLSSAYPEGAEEGDDAVSFNVEYGSAVTLRAIVKAVDPGKVKFEWYSVVQYGSQSDWELITGADTAEYEIKSVKAKEGYHCKVSDGVKEFDLDFDISVGKPLSVKAEGAKESESNTARLYADEGSTLTLRAIVSADDGSQLKYKWSSGVMEWDEEGYPYYSGFETIEGADKAEYLIEYAEESLYKCTVSDQYGNSADALFYVYTEYQLHAYPEGVGATDENYLFLDVKPFETATLRVIVEAIDTSGITYQWQEKVEGGEEEYAGEEDPIGDDYGEEFGDGDDGDYGEDDDYGDDYDYDDEVYTDIEGANEDSYRLIVAEYKEYRCVVSDRYGNTEYVYFYLEIDNELKVYPEGAEEGSNSVDIYAAPGDTVTLKVNAEALDDSGLTYKWKDEDWVQLDEEQDELVIENVTQSQSYTCDVSDQYESWGNAVFNIVIENHLKAYPEGSENTDEQDMTVLPFSPVTLKVVAEADDMSGLTYQWIEYTDAIEGADTDTYTIPSVDYGTKYCCEVRDRYNNTKTVTFHVNVDNGFSAYPEGAKKGQNTVDVYVDYGQPVTLRTIVNARNKDKLTYWWDCYNYNLSGSEAGNEYMIDSVTDQETFLCCAGDGFGNSSYVYFNIYVGSTLEAYPEGYKGHDTTTIYVEPGSKVTLSAVVEADDQEELVFWWDQYMGGGEFESLHEHKSTITVDAEDAIYILHVSDEDDNDKEVRFNLKLREKVPAIDISEAALTVSDVVYNGTERKPEVRVAHKGRVLKQGTDYTISYENNVNAGVKTAKAVVTGDNVALRGKKKVAFSVLPGKTSRGDMFNLAGNVKVTWKAVPGAKYYKVYREGVTNAAESVSEPVIVTSRLVGWDKAPGLVNGHAYRYRIVASLTGAGGAGGSGSGSGNAAGGGAGGLCGGADGGSGSGASSDLSGDSPLSYSKLMYRLKTVAIKRVKNTEPGKAKVWFDKTTSGDSYVLQYCEREDMVGAKTKVILGADNTSYTIGGLKKGKTYYISIRVRKKVNGIDYYTTFGVPKKIRIEK